MNMDEEIWNTVEKFSSYEISNFGNLRNKNTKYIIKPTIKSGYLSTSIKNDNGERKTLKIHRLVALCFIPNLLNKETVNHKDHNKLNNKLDNLEWATTTEQNNHKRKCKKEIQELVSSRAVWRIDKYTNEKLEYYKTITKAAKWIFDNNLTSIIEFNDGNNIKTRISAVCQKKYGRNTSFGYKWEYCNENENKYIDEEWKDIPSDIIKGINGYKISNYGRVKNHKGRITEGSNHESGYLWVSIAPHQYLLHRLVAKVFIPNLENKEQVNHVDGNKQNACVYNLEWCTNIENQKHKINSGLSNCTKKIIQYDLQMNKIKEFNSQMESSRELNICYTSISKCCLNKQKTAGGFIFKFNE
jgi:hypothetical protein